MKQAGTTPSETHSRLLETAGEIAAHAEEPPLDGIARITVTEME